MKKRKALLLVIAVMVAVMGVAAASVYIFRQEIKLLVFQALSEQVRLRYGYKLEVKNVEIRFPDEVELTGVKLFDTSRVTHQENQSPLLVFKKINVKVLNLLNPKEASRLSRVVLDSGYVDVSQFVESFARRDSAAHRSTEQNRFAKVEHEKASASGWNHKVRSFYAKLFDYLPDEIWLNNVRCRYQNQLNEVQANLVFEYAFLVRGHYEVLLNLEDASCADESNSVEIIAAGNLQKNSKELSVAAYVEKPFARLPFIEKFTGRKISFDSVRIALYPKILGAEQSTLAGSIDVANFSIDDKRMASQPIEVKSFSANCTVFLGEHSLRIDSSTVCKLNHLPLKFAAWLDKSDSLKAGFQLQTDTLPANLFFAALPGAMLSEMDGYDFRGKIAYSLFMDIDFQHLENIVLSPKVYQSNFQVASLGGQNSLSKLQSDFLYTAKSGGKEVQTIDVSTSSPFYKRLESLPPHLIWAVLTNEDGAFFRHHGFNTDAFSQSIADNIREQRFARGGSTITMQLVKNLYLTKEKTLARKFQEVLITWILENSGIVSKERMLEIYFNIIEWGPNVYGIGQASLYYFNKLPYQLTPAESVFLTSIIPMPKSFARAFDKNGQVTNGWKSKMKFIASEMFRRGYLETDDLNYDINLSGQALEDLKKVKQGYATMMIF
ncbi:glycosyl transferase family 51 [Chloroherpeton thalassium ATCC 35110]|uniref:Glycosyl transferase family 51 n=1 Tax=Chloroherpeton thalassium (strain ATCC 35110 / GB-78) TaxID=517418 RepID=B3QVW6_CHLT3|nr:biosynthetic peptidoglycan transglycosylase [Chloroherpeton thalassium]ACF14620.1 glycosyl transferase family 51 [Chloroherpeton thalassium ATCC 35110]